VLLRRDGHHFLSGLLVHQSQTLYLLIGFSGVVDDNQVKAAKLQLMLVCEPGERCSFCWCIFPGGEVGVDVSTMTSLPLEQSPNKRSNWAKLARQGHDIAWEFERSGGPYTGRMLIDGEIYTPSQATRKFLKN
jgi:hypothetical protein